MLQLALNDAYLFIDKEAPPIKGMALEKLSKDFLSVQHIINRLSRIYSVNFLELMIDLPALTLNMMQNEQLIKEWSGEASSKLQIIGKKLKINFDLNIEKSTSIDADTFYQLVLTIREHGVSSSKVYDSAFFSSSEYKKIADLSNSLLGLISDSCYIQKGDDSQEIVNFKEGLDWLLKKAKRGQGIQRYKGLGEMNPEQLWETTMNPETRNLLQVSVEDALIADQTFTTLMGDEVAPRRDFIESNALLVENLDV